MALQSDKWPIHKTVGFLLLAGAALWVALGFTLRVLFH